MSNLCMLTDSYKLSHFSQYPKNIETVYSYMEARGGESTHVYFYGLGYYLKEYLSKPISQADINEAAGHAKRHGVPFNTAGWNHILDVHGGFLPIIIEAVPEGSWVKTGEPMLLMYNTDPECFWLVNYLETLIMKMWYPITVATRCGEIYRTLSKHWSETCEKDLTGVAFAFHNFGDRGSSSVESALIGGLAHLQFFKGTDNFNTLSAYCHPEGFSIPASEHSTVTSWGKDNEFEMYQSYIETYKDQPIVACVMDSYNIFEAVHFISTGDMKARIDSEEYPIFVIRPDSGDPLEIVPRLLNILVDNGVKMRTNSQGYLELENYRIIWGDGITRETIDAILTGAKQQGFAAKNFAFGSGGYVMQDLNRDTHKMAIKCCAVELDDGTIREVYKDPITGSGKRSKAGIQRSPDFVTAFANGHLTGE